MNARVAAFAFAVCITALWLLPARYLFLALGVFMVAAGCYLLPIMAAKAVLAIIVGVLFLALGVWVVLREQRAAADDARRAADTVRTVAARDRRNAGRP